MKMVIKFLLFISLVCAVRGFPEGEKEITSNIKDRNPTDIAIKKSNPEV